MVIFDDTLVNLGFISKICTKCKHFNSGSIDFDKNIIGTCKAFPNGIPHAIWLGKNNHKKPYRGDNGVQFEEKYTIAILKRKKE